MDTSERIMNVHVDKDVNTWISDNRKQHVNVDYVTAAFWRVTKNVVDENEKGGGQMRSVRNSIMHYGRLEISQQDMKENFDVMLNFLNHIKSEKNKDDVTVAIDRIKKLRTDDDECLLLQIRKAINENLSEAKWEYLHTQAEIISYMASESNQLPSSVETAESINKENKDELKAKSISSTRHKNWYISTLALRYLKPAFLSVVQDKVNSVHEEIVSQFGRLTCAEATAEDIESKGNTVQFKHTDCSGQVYDCQTPLNIIKSHTVKSGKSFEMLQGTDPQKWLKTSFDFACLFIPHWLRRRIEDFKGFDIRALCVMVNQCKPLIEMFDGNADRCSKDS